MNEAVVGNVIRKWRERAKYCRRKVRRMRKRGFETPFDFLTRKKFAQNQVREATATLEGWKGLLESNRILEMRKYEASIKDLPVIRVPSPDKPEKKRRGRSMKSKPAWAMYGPPKLVKQSEVLSSVQERALEKLSETEWQTAFKLDEHVATLQHLVAIAAAEGRGYELPGWDRKNILEFRRKQGIVVE